jgi:hypothetical protein
MNIRKKQDRATMARRLADALVSAGAVVKVKPEGSEWHNKRRVLVEWTANGYGAHTAFDGESNVGCFLVHWFSQTGTKTKLGYDFACAAGSVNEYHRQKATTMVGLNDFDGLLTRVQVCVEMLRNGRAFENVPSREKSMLFPAG